jgi:hypothetical protein
MKLPLGKFLLLFGLLITFTSLQAQQHEWAKAIKSTKHIDSSYSHIHPFSLKTDSKGNVLTSGLFGGSFDFDPNNGSVVDSSVGYMNSFILKLDSNGSYITNQAIVGGRVSPYFSEIDHNDNYYLSIYSNFDTLKIDSNTIILDSSTNDYLIKFNGNNNFQWVLNYQKTSWYTGGTIQTDHNNNIYLTGTVIADRGKDSVDMNPSTTEEYKIYSAYLTPYLLKLDSNGNFQWVKTFACCYNSTGANSLNNLFNYSYLSDTIINTPNGLDTIELNYMYNKSLSSINPNNGNINWQVPIFSNQPTLFYNYTNNIELQTDALGNVYLFGSFDDSLFIGTSPQQTFISNGSRDGFISKFDSTGNLVWFTQFDGNNLNRFKSVSINDSGNFFIGTELFGKYNFPTDSGQVSYYASPENRMTLIKFKTNGKFDWAKPIEAGVGSQIEAIDWSRATNSIYSTGIYHQELIARDTLTADNRNNLYITKTKLCDPIPFYDTLYLCAGDSSYIPNVNTEHAGNYSQLVENSSGCDSIRYTHLVVYPDYADTTIYSFCEGDSLFYDGKYYRSDTTLLYPATTKLGCDSNQIILIQRDSNSFTQLSPIICEGDSFYLGNKPYYESGLYSDTLMAVSGCDSVVEVELTVHPKVNQQNISICEGESYNIGNSTYTESGVYSDTLTSFYQCDSIVITNLTVVQKRDSTISVKLCEGESITIYNHIYQQSGTYTQYINAGTCQMKLTIKVNVLNVKRRSQSFELCPRDSVIVGNEVYYKGGKYSDTLQAKNGCDSIVETQISIPEFDITLNENSLTVSSEEEYKNVQVLWYNCDSKRILYDENRERFEFKLSGNYAPIIIMENCRDTLLCNQVTYYGDYELKVFPNPAKDVCTIVVPTAGTMKLYNSNGSLIQERYFSESREYIHHIPNWATGIYMVVFEGEEGILTEKLSIVD